MDIQSRCRVAALHAIERMHRDDVARPPSQRPNYYTAEELCGDGIMVYRHHYLRQPEPMWHFCNGGSTVEGEVRCARMIDNEVRILGTVEGAEGRPFDVVTEQAYIRDDLDRFMAEPIDVDGACDVISELRAQCSAAEHSRDCWKESYDRLASASRRDIA